MFLRKMSNKKFVNLEMLGETIVVIAAALWMLRQDWIAIAYAIGAVLMAVGRFAQGYEGKDLVLRRLYGIRKLGCVMLLFSSALMFVKAVRYLAYGVYLFPTSWLLFFVVFVVIEVYTTIRILHISK